MKVSKEDQATLARLIAIYDTEDTRELYRSGNYPRAGETKDINKRYRWDLFWTVFKWHRKEVYPMVGTDYNDAHIDTALRKIVKEL